MQASTDTRNAGRRGQASRGRSRALKPGFRRPAGVLRAGRGRTSRTLLAGFFRQTARPAQPRLDQIGVRPHRRPGDLVAATHVVDRSAASPSASVEERGSPPGDEEPYSAASAALAGGAASAGGSATAPVRSLSFAPAPQGYKLQ